MLNVLHHIPQVEQFFSECVRCLCPGGKVCIVDQHRGWLSAPILKYCHHEPYDELRQEWSFESTGPLSGANGALAYLVFERDLQIFNERYPELTVSKIQSFSPLMYWLAGGLKRWSLVPGQLYPFANALDTLLGKLHYRMGSFIEIELTRR